MSKDTVNQRVVKAINYLLEQGIVNKKGDIAEALQCSAQTITEILGGRQGMKVDVLQKFFAEFNISYAYIFEGSGSILKETSSNALINAQENALKSPASTLDLRKSKSTTLENQEKSSSLFLPHSGKTISTKMVELPVPVKDELDTVNVPIVDISVAAGCGFDNPYYLDEIDSIKMPRSMIKKGRTYLCVRIKGDSMIPTLQDGGYLIIRMLDRSEWQYIREEHVYVVSNTEGTAFVKRLKNRFKEHGFIVCMSDNPDVMLYPNFNLKEDEINMLWYVEWYISAKMPNIHLTYYKKISQMEDSIIELKEGLQGLSGLGEEVKRLHHEVYALKQRN